MWGSNRVNRKQAGITLIANNCEIVGDVHFSDQLQVNGFVKGNIIAQKGTNAKVTVSERGKVKGEIRVPTVVIDGQVQGDIYSGKHIELAAKSRINGNVYYNLIEMVMGSRVDGNLIHLSDSEKVVTKQSVEPRRRVPPPTAPKVAAVSDSVSDKAS